MTRIPAEEVVRFGTDVFIDLGAPSDIAADTAESLVSADLAGHYSHGIRLIPTYTRQIEEGKIDPAARPSLLWEDDVAVAVNGNVAFGQHVGRFSTEQVLPKVAEHGVAAIAMRHSTHLARMGEWAEWAAAAGLAMVGFTCNPPTELVAPPGSAEGKLSTNPVVFGLPSFDALDFPLVLDMATSQVAYGKIREKADAGEPVPGEWSTPYPGKPDPEPMRADGPGAILPLGGRTSGYKGFGLSIMSELLAGCFSDGYVSGQPDMIHGNQSLWILADPLKFTDKKRVEDRILSIREHIASAERHPDMDVGEAAYGDIYLLPGESEHRQRTDQLANGVTYNDIDIDILATVARDRGLVDSAPPQLGLGD